MRLLFCISLLLCMASPSIHAVNKFCKKESPVKVTRKNYLLENMPAVRTAVRTAPEDQHETFYYIYTPEARVRTTTRGQVWKFAYSREFISHAKLKDKPVIPFGESDQNLDFNAFFRVTTAPGYYLFRSVNREYVPIYIPGIHELTASTTRAQIPDNHYGQIDLSTYVEGEGLVIYQIADYAPDNVFIYFAGRQIEVDENGKFEVHFYGGSEPQKITILSAKTGAVKIQAEFGFSKKFLHLSFEREGKAFLILRNANDSNKDHEADYKSRDQVTDDDPDLFKFTPLGPEHGMPAEMADFITTGELPDGQPTRLTLKVPASFNIYSSAKKTPFQIVSAVEGYHLVYHWDLTPGNRDNIVQTLNNIYLEGAVPSESPNTYEITFDIIPPPAEGEQPPKELPRRAQWTASVIDLFINRSMQPAPYHVASLFPVPRIKNPAVISYVPPDSNPAQLDQLSFLFEVQSSNMEMLEYFRDQIEWALYAEEGTNPVQFVPEGAMFGKSIRLRAVEDGDVTIGVRLRGTDSDYLQITRPVVPMKPIPVSFQFFTANYTYNSRQSYEEFITFIPDILLCMNLIARQSGIVFHPVDPADPGTRSGFLDKLSFTVESEDGAFFLPRWITSRPPVLPLIQTKNRYIIADPPQEWVGSIISFRKDDQTGRFHITKGSVSAPPNADKNYFPPPIKYPALVIPQIPDQTPLLYKQGALMYKDVPSWVIETAWPYTMAISSANNAVSFNFLPVGDFKNGKIGAITGLLSPSPQMLPIDTGRPVADNDARQFVQLSHYKNSHLFPILGWPGEPDRGHACVVLTPPDLAGNKKMTAIPNYARLLIAAALRTLGLKERSLMGELDAYQDQELLNTALQQKILLHHEGRLIINPVTPLTAHEDAVINPYDDILSLDPQQQYGYRLDESRTSLLREHPFTIPQVNPPPPSP